MKTVKINDKRCFYYINAQSIDDLYNLVFGYESCDNNKPPTGPIQKNCFLIHYVLSGKGILYLNGKMYELGTDDIFLISPFTTYNYIPDKQDPWEYIWFEFNGAKAKSLCDEAMLTSEDPVYHCKSKKIRESLVNVLYIPSHANALELHSLSYLTSLLSQVVDERTVGSNIVSKKHENVYKVQNMINNNYADCNLRLSYISSYLYMNPSYFSRTFKEVTGVTLTQYITSIRMQKARGLLASRSYSVCDIASMVGYSDTNYFTTEFKKFYGICPSKFNDYVDS